MLIYSDNINNKIITINYKMLYSVIVFLFPSQKHAKYGPYYLTDTFYCNTCHVDVRIHMDFNMDNAHTHVYVRRAAVCLACYEKHFLQQH